MMSIVTRHMTSPLGTLVLEASAGGLTRVHFAQVGADGTGNVATFDGPLEAMGAPASEAHAILDRAAKALSSYFAGQPAELDRLPLAADFARSKFQAAVLRHLRGLPSGKRITYGELALTLGCPGAARAVGSALAANPVLLVLPCHRIVPRSGGPGGYAGGSWRKEWLLEWESNPAAAHRPRSPLGIPRSII